jgi:UDP-N-acetyl-D-mannosaminuronate dehydrogenase
MNANELAVYLEDITDWEESPYRQAATMLRQQQAEIGFYKQDADKYKQKCASQQAEIEALKKQVDVLSKAFETVCDGLETSLDLNKAQAERYWSEHP